MGSWRNSSSGKILWMIITPLVLILGFMALKKSNWGSGFVYSYTWGSSGDDSAAKGPVSSENSGGSLLDWRWKVVDGGGGGGGGQISQPPSSSSSSSSSTPPIALEEDMDMQQPVSAMDQDDNFTATLNGSDIFLRTNETYDPPSSTGIQRNFSGIDKLEASLMQARAAIRETISQNQINDPDYTPFGPIYWNASVFHRSYLEMEKRFKVYVYEEGEPPIFHNGPCKSIYAMEGNFIFQMETTKLFRTRDPDKAHIFFLPMSSTMMVRFILERGSRDHWRPMKRTVKDYVDLVASKYPFWNRSLGADHFIVACHDWGPELSKAVPNLFTNSIRAFCNANTSEGFKPSKDVSIPEILLRDGTMQGLVGGPSPRQRHILAFFAGGVHGPIRPILLEHWENKDPDVQVHKYLPKGVSYIDMLRQSKYCISPSGYEVASPRMVEALYTGCVPVLIKDHYVAPFSDVLNWKSFAVIIPVEDIPNLKKILMGISTRQYLRMQRRGKQVKRHFEVNYPPKRYDVFHMILHSVWLRRLNARIHGSN
ncbi:probable glycosyltransferase At5g03795 [Cynara cardunculus var. scolymus]|uniref:probable glycosyltransferase At5g03795 n=1 Tax=Cynara cardunculus var. scolymus TaxID=59895 RepID=UPI000D62FFB4|nr:probable glycosyltransferase At5g03795 [Cynara cardunculus var. scolymus]